MDVTLYKIQLIEKQKTLQVENENNKNAADIVTLDQSAVGRLSRMDALQAQAMSIATKKRREFELVRIKSALIRLDNHEYGYCLHCDEDIPEKRLTVDPAATLCIECANKNEK